MEAKETKQPRQPQLIHSLIVFALLIAVMAVGIIVYG